MACTEVGVLILGETGTGKGLAARIVHQLSRRGAGPFIQVNCGALPEGLVESELFGHERGAFTGAISRKVGKVELAQGGTLFLDEVGDLALEAQAKLLEVLEEGTFERVGETQILRADIRVIAAQPDEEAGDREDMNADLAFDVLTPLGFRVRCTRSGGDYISTVKHPVLKGRIHEVIDTLEHPLEVRRSTKDAKVLLFYRKVAPRFLVAVTRRENGEGFLITVYPGDRLKKGEVVWTESS